MTRPGADPWARMARSAGAAGLAAVVLLFGPLIAVSSLGEPPLAATEADAAAFFRAADVSWVQAAEAAFGVGTLALLWFVVGFGLLLRRAEGDPPWRSTLAVLSGTLLVAYTMLDASWDAAAHLGSEIDPGLASYAFHVGNLGFANAWLAAAGFALAAGWVVLETRTLARWLGWAMVVSGVGLVLARFVWTVDSAWFAPYAVFWVWVIAVCVRLVRRPSLDPGRATA